MKGNFYMPDEHRFQRRVKAGEWVDSEEALQPRLDAMWNEYRQVHGRFFDGSMPISEIDSWYERNRYVEYGLFLVYENLEAIRERDAWSRNYASKEERLFRTAEAAYIAWSDFPTPIRVPAEAAARNPAPLVVKGKKYQDLQEYSQAIKACLKKIWRRFPSSMGECETAWRAPRQ